MFTKFSSRRRQWKKFDLIVLLYGKKEIHSSQNEHHHRTFLRDPDIVVVGENYFIDTHIVSRGELFTVEVFSFALIRRVYLT